MRFSSNCPTWADPSGLRSPLRPMTVAPDHQPGLQHNELYAFNFCMMMVEAQLDPAHHLLHHLLHHSRCAAATLCSAAGESQGVSRPDGIYNPSREFWLRHRASSCWVVPNRFLRGRPAGNPDAEPQLVPSDA